MSEGRTFIVILTFVYTLVILQTLKQGTESVCTLEFITPYI